jgi:mono/diheme cytochrome c family protein
MAGKLNWGAGGPRGPILYAWVVACLFAFLSGCRSVPALTPQQTEGKRLYDGRCAHCHEDNDLNLKTAPPSLHRVFVETDLPSGVPATDANVRQVVLAGKGLMPAFAGRFTDEQMAALLAYLHAGLRPEGP